MADEIRKRSEIEEQYKWDLTHIYASDEAWKEALDSAMAGTEALAALDGKVAEDPKKAILTVLMSSWLSC
jgi:oligoendopeptidase F